MDVEGGNRSSWFNGPLVVPYSLLWAILCDLVLEASIWLTTQAPWFSPILLLDRFAVGVLFVWIVIWLLLVLTGRLWLSFGLTLTLSALIGAANAVKISYLTEPVVPSDLAFVTEPRFLLGMVSGRWLIVTFGVVALVVLTLIVASRRFTLQPPWSKPGLPRRRRIGLHSTRVAVGTLLMLALLQAGDFGQDESNLWRRAFEANGASWASWDAYQNYLRNGFIGGFLYLMPVTPMTRPGGYSESAVTEIVDRLAHTSLSAGHRAPNVVVVLCEGCSDPLQLPEVRLPEDPLVNYRRLASESWSGELVAWRFGTGTSVMEFQILTGQSMALFSPQLNTPYAGLVAHQDTYPSVVDWFNHHAYDTTAIHSFRGSMYRRFEAYDVLGFSSFLDEEDMTETARLGPWISDASALDQALGVLRESDNPQFVHLVTMQNHTPSFTEMPDSMVVESTPIADERELGGYASGMRATDAALAEFLSEVTTLDEPTTVLFFGDHLPPFYNVPGGGDEPPPQYVRTPFLIWSTEAGPAPRDLGTIGATALMPLVFKYSGMPSPPYFRLLLQQSRKLGAIERTQVTDTHNHSETYENLDDAEAALLEDLRIIQYDLSVGSRSSRPDLWGY